MTTQLDDQIRTVLSAVHDPCSVAAGRPMSVLDMGLVLGWTLKGGALSVRFCVTSASCSMAPHFTQAAKEELLKLEAIEEVQVDIDTDHLWLPDQMKQPKVEMKGEPQSWRKRVPQAKNSSHFLSSSPK
ncbi:MAG: iron-sulfur cluster assembly protein [Pseudomonadota bacterium]